MKNIYKTRRGGSLFTMGMLVRWKNITCTIPNSYEDECRKCLSCIKKSPFKHQEGHVLECWRAFPWTLKGVGRIGERRKKFTSLGRVRNEDSAEQIVGKTGNSWQDTVAKIAGQSGAADRKDWWSRQDRAEQTAGKAGTDGKEGGRGTGGKAGEERERLSSESRGRRT